MDSNFTPIRISPPRCPKTGVDEEACSIYLQDLRDNIFAKQVALDGIRNLTRYSKDEVVNLAAFIERLKLNDASPDIVRRFETELDKMFIFIYKLFVEGISAMVKQDFLGAEDVEERVRDVIKFEMGNEFDSSDLSMPASTSTVRPEKQYRA
ncbi:hypothetical protein CkaCkLH20_04075 [Colletotrichum karsti]|uniref:Uncharacterized protein n=1 Tax=Colletotrichum karsti TaxID=1095194 RepID=A0A9P6I917_9PEZI|nr:uncharacterized protein CkaCkLH20_04075 [Colletotrichum karsti]KAF9878583.1 hypothetical protein CkaCkLH20_04075 [Colletotrichum karsti]